MIEAFRTARGIGLVLGACTLAGTAHAADFTVSSGTTETTTQTLTDPGDTGTIEAGGAIATTGNNHGVHLQNQDQTVSNAGAISTDGLSAHGVQIDGANGTVDNSGTILTDGTNSFGVRSDGDNSTISNSGAIETTDQNSTGIGIAAADNATVINSGTITIGDAFSGGIVVDTGANATIINSGSIATTGSFANGIHLGAGSDNGVVTNSGSITTGDQFSHGVYVDSSNDVTVTNSGAITTTGLQARGIDFNNSDNATAINNATINTTGDYGYAMAVSGADATITNNSGIETTGEYGHGVYSDGADARITNRGTVRTLGANSDGIRAEGTGAVVVNSGTVIATRDAFAMWDTNQTVRLLAGSVVQGDIRFNDAASATLDIGPGLNTMLTLNGVPATITMNGMACGAGGACVVSGSTVAAVATEGFAASAPALADLTGGIAGTLESRLGSPAASGGPRFVTAYGPEDKATPFDRLTTAGLPDTGSYWADTFGGFRVNGGSSVGNQMLGGLVIGFDRAVSGQTRAGAFAGGALSRAETDASGSTITGRSAYAGLYLRHHAEPFVIDASLTGGYTGHTSKRRMVDNMAPGGIATASADYGGWFVSPSVTFGSQQPIGATKLKPSLRLRYAGLFNEGYAESGSSADMTVGGRASHVAEIRGQVEVALEGRQTGRGQVSASARTGVDGIFAWGDDVTANLLGTDISFAPGGEDFTARGFGGFDVSLAADNGLTWRGGLELGVDTTGALSGQVRAGVSRAF